jgi:dihydrofolate reductase
MKGGTTFYFVTDGIESALEQAWQAAGDNDVLIGGGANVVQQYLAAELVDEFELHVVPILLGDGERLLENVGDLKLEQVRAVDAPGVTTSSTASSIDEDAVAVYLRREYAREKCHRSWVKCVLPFAALGQIRTCLGPSKKT